ncbi:MAG: GYD domain-containing protein [Chloroflexota bacterium]|nr:GYD domain-containing protein [Chloroflexota bacterium]
MDAGRQAAQQLGVEVRAVYVVMGQYDLVSLFDAPDDVTAARFALTLASQGNVTTETLRAFAEEEFRQLVAALP